MCLLGGRYLRIVNTNDVVPRVPPPVGSAYQHPNHLMYIKPNYIIMRASKNTAGHSAKSSGPANGNNGRNNSNGNHQELVAAGTFSVLQQNGDRLEAAFTTTTSGRTHIMENNVHAGDPYEHHLKPIRKLIEQPEIYYITALAASATKLVLPVLVALLWALQWPLWPVIGFVKAVWCTLSSAVMSAYILLGCPLWVTCVSRIKYGLIDPTVLSWANTWHGLVTTVEQVPRETGIGPGPRELPFPIPYTALPSPNYILTRYLAVMGASGVVIPLVIMEVLLCPLLLLTPLLPLEVLLACCLSVLVPPGILTGVIDHSMMEYYHAVLISAPQDW